MKKIAVLSILVLCFLGASAQQEKEKKYSLITDLADTSATVKSLKLLLNSLEIFPDGAIRQNEIVSRQAGLVIMLSDDSRVSSYQNVIKNYLSAGGTVVMDIRAFAFLNGLKTKNINLRSIKVKQESAVTSGYRKGEPIIYNNKGSLLALDKNSVKGITILGEGKNGEAVLVMQKRGKGKIVAIDLLSMQEPKVYADTENKYLFLVNAIGNGVKYGRWFPEKVKYPEFVSMLKDLVKKYPSITLTEEGDATGGNKIYSLSMGNPSNPGIFIYSNTHGNEWENSYGTLNFVQYLAEHPDQNIIDFNKYFLKVIPLLNPYGHEHMTRQNGNLVDLNRNGDNNWEKFSGEQPYKPGSYDWKGTAPFSEPEAQTLRKAAESANYIAFLDIHGNPSGTGFNKSLSISGTGKPDSQEKGQQFEKYFNEALIGRYILQQTHEKTIKSFLIDYVSTDTKNPLLYVHISNDKYGFLVELLCGYNGTGFMPMQTDIVGEMCTAFCKTFAK
jgi:hypothetical protein